MKKLLIPIFFIIPFFGFSQLTINAGLSLGMQKQTIKEVIEKIDTVNQTITRTGYKDVNVNAKDLILSFSSGYRFDNGLLLEGEGRLALSNNVFGSLKFGGILNNGQGEGDEDLSYHPVILLAGYDFFQNKPTFDIKYRFVDRFFLLANKTGTIYSLGIGFGGFLLQ